MTAAPALHHPDDIDPAAYSTRACRCGERMQRLLVPAGAWSCPSCGRRDRR